MKNNLQLVVPVNSKNYVLNPSAELDSNFSSSLFDDLVAYWNLNETSGDRADATGNGHTLTDNNTVGYATGKINNAASFVAANSGYLSIADPFYYNEITICGWINANDNITLHGVS